MLSRLHFLMLSLLISSLQGCAGPDGPSLTSLQPANPPPNTGAVKPVSELLMGPLPVGSPTEIYTRVGGGILKCWFGSEGPLKGHYKFYADAEPPSKGGASQISIHSKDETSLDPRSIRAWRVGILPSPDGTSLQIENFKLPAVLAQHLDSDVRRWGAGEEGCLAHPPLTVPSQPGKDVKLKPSHPQMTSKTARTKS